jgi:hypothetical protein
MPRSTLSNNVSSALGSIMGGSASTSSSTSASGLVFGSDASSTSAKSNDSTEIPKLHKSRIPDGPSKPIHVPFEIVVVCGPNGLIVHPGGYRITRSALEDRTNGSLLTDELLAVAQNRAVTDPSIRPQPRVKFLVESGGSPAFWAARKQILFSGLGWPMSLQVTGAQDLHLLEHETW